MKWAIPAFCMCVGLIAGTVAQITKDIEPSTKKPRPIPTNPPDITFRIYTDCVDAHFSHTRELPRTEEDIKDTLLQLDTNCIHWAGAWSAGFKVRELSKKESDLLDERRRQYLSGIYSLIVDIQKKNMR